MSKVCTFPGCERKHLAKGLCAGHWGQQYRRQELTTLKPRRGAGEEASGAIYGYRGAARVLGVSQSSVLRVFNKARELGLVEPRQEVIRGKSVFVWASRAALLTWYGKTQGKVQPQRRLLQDKVQAQDRTRSVIPSSTSQIVGIRAAATTLGVHRTAVGKVLADLREGDIDLIPDMVKVSDGKGQTGANPMLAYAWENEEAVLSWWASVGKKQAVPPALRARDPEPMERAPRTRQLTKEEMITALLGEGTSNALSELQVKLDTPAVRALRTVRGEEPKMPLSEVLVLVVGLGLANWPEE